MSLLRQSNGMRPIDIGGSGKVGTNRRHSVSTTDRAVAPPFRNRVSHLPAGVLVASTDNASTIAAGRPATVSRRRQSFDSKVRVCICIFHYTFAYVIIRCASKMQNYRTWKVKPGMKKAEDRCKVMGKVQN